MLAAQVFLPRSGTLLHAGGIGLGLGLTSRCMQTLGATPKAACTLGRGTDHPIAQHDNVPTADPLAWVRFPVVVNYADVLGGAERHQRVGQLEGGGPSETSCAGWPTRRYHPPTAADASPALLPRLQTTTSARWPTRRLCCSPCRRALTGPPDARESAAAIALASAALAAQVFLPRSGTLLHAGGMSSSCHHHHRLA